MQIDLDEIKGFPTGFTYLGKHAGLKINNLLDLSVIHSEIPATAAAVFTSHQFPGAPIILGKEKIKQGKLQTIVINSRIANVATGEQGIQDALNTCEIAARELQVDKELVLPSSTGIIGRKLDMDKIEKALIGIKSELNQENFYAAAQGIMTTDTFPKWTARSLGNITISGMAKGAGMIHPNMATMLAFIQTDASLEASILNTMLKKAVNQSFNRISVDGDMSTSDTVLIMANGLAGEVDENLFQNELTDLCIELAKLIVKDGEGATKIINVQVQKAHDQEQAEKIARAIANSSLFKTAIYGADPNWGRIYGAMGKVRDIHPIEIKKVEIYIGSQLVFKNGAGVPFDQAKAHEYLTQSSVEISVLLNEGEEYFNVWTCDLTEGYIKENAYYTT